MNAADVPAALMFRTATATDAKAIVELIESAYRGPASRAGWTTEADLLDGQRTDLTEILGALARNDVTMVLAISDTGELVGCCQLERRAPELAYFGSFAVGPGLQSQGLGRALLAEAERRAVELWQVKAIEMTVIAQRENLIGWYERRGYVRTGETRPFPYHDVRAGLPKRPDLYFVVLSKQLTGAFPP